MGVEIGAQGMLSGSPFGIVNLCCSKSRPFYEAGSQDQCYFILLLDLVQAEIAHFCGSGNTRFFAFPIVQPAIKIWRGGILSSNCEVRRDTFLQTFLAGGRTLKLAAIVFGGVWVPPGPKL
jgi:hypothetical protein